MTRLVRPPVEKAARAYRAFTGHKAQKVARARLDAKDVTGWKLGPAVGIAYEAKRDGVTSQYFHEFAKDSRPDLVSRDDGRQLYISGGRYRVTARGIEDMPSLFVVNPSPRTRRRVATKRKSPTMARAHRRRRTTRRRAPRQVAVFRTNPVRRRRRRARRSTVHHFRRNPIRRMRARRSSTRVRRYRRNPSARAGAVNFGKMLMPAAGIGLGAVGSEIIMGYLPIPANLKTGVMRHITKGAVGIGAGLVLGKLFKQRRLGNYFALGAVAIAVHDAVKEMIASRMPSVPMGQYTRPIRSSLGYVSPGQLRMGGMSEYVGAVGSSFAGGGGGETDFSV